ncbi:hypothetical protein N7507_001973 [Penicillium longicatenatum]|nr:hypothetical protein N7507_001973 [Penicillium longicatenatum]
MSSYKAIIFDMGDVLFRWEPRLSTKIPTDTLRTIAHSELWYQYEQGGISSDQCYQRLSEMYGFSCEEIASTFRQSTGCLKPDPAMTDFLHELKGRQLPIYMMTNIPRLDFDQLRSVDYAWGLIDEIFASGYLGMRKPDGRFYEHVLAKIGVAASEVIFVDDREENVEAAQRLGMTGFLFSFSSAQDIRREMMTLLA